MRVSFKSRYHHFKLLLSANNSSLEIMAEMDEAIRGTQPFGMTFIRARCTRVSTHVFQIIKHLDELAPGKYETLYERFKEIQGRINPILYFQSPPDEGPLVLPLRAVDRNLADQVGGKMANLGEILNRLHLRIPNGFVITARGYRRFLEHNDLQSEIDRRLQITDTEHPTQLYGLSADLQQLIIGSELPQDLAQAILDHYRFLEEEEGRGVTMAMRSSALGEDVAGASFAGQYRSELNVSGENILQAYKEVVAAKYGLPAMTYRLNRGMRDEDVDMCVGCLRMVDAISGGVLYSRNPVNIRDDSIIINSVWGLPKAVVDGSTPADLFVITRGEPAEIRHKTIRVKEHRLVCYPDEGICREDMNQEQGGRASLREEQALELARLAMRLEAYYHAPQDIEWAIAKDGAVILLQCRQLKQVELAKEEATRVEEETEPASVILHGGVMASPGIAAGPVFIVRKDMDALQFPSGAVLVAVQSLPRWATVLNRAVAVVTEQGSLAGHLANVAREFSVPALFEVSGIMDRLRNGQLVTVDADGLRIHDGRIDALLKDSERPKNLMAGTPVFEALKEVAQHIASLNLLDPDAPEFKPQNCKTLHDITRFCHEKAVHEMFRFGKEHHFPERSSKQLFCEVPMQWWVLNLDDGFGDEVTGKYVRIENIVSIPMLALWEGITAIPWEGPPPLDGRGFMAVMYEATRNTALTTGVRSQYASRNYFMISKNYCSLNSRLGFHFSTVEALVSDRRSENYTSFQFKGGAADYDRRLKRVLFVKDILEECAFRVEVKEDTLIARLEGYEKDFMKTRLKILGHLIIHTRQLDMIMSNDASINYYGSKILKDIQNMVSEG